MKAYIKLLLFSVAIAVLLLALVGFGFEKYIHSAWPFMLLFYFLQSLLILIAEKRITRGKNQNFVLFVIGSISFRLVSALLAAVAYLLLAGQQNTHFILLFFGLYLLFLGFELFTLMTNLRSNFET